MQGRKLLCHGPFLWWGHTHQIQKLPHLMATANVLKKLVFPKCMIEYFLNQEHYTLLKSLFESASQAPKYIVLCGFDKSITFKWNPNGCKVTASEWIAMDYFWASANKFEALWQIESLYWTLTDHWCDLHGALIYTYVFCRHVLGMSVNIFLL